MAKKPVKQIEELKDELEDILEAGIKRYYYAEEQWREQRQAALDDLAFYQGEQWDVTNQARRETNVTVNRLPTFVKQVENSLRQQEIAINVFPTDEIGSEETAAILAGMVRSIERKSHAPAQYMHAIGENGALVPGFGFLKLETEYVNRSSNLQEIKIKAVKDPFKVLPDPDARESDCSDAEYWFEIEDYTREQFKRAFPSSKLASFAAESVGTTRQVDQIRVLRYWFKEEFAQTRYLFEDGTEKTSFDLLTPADCDDESVKESEEWPSDENGEKKPFIRKRIVLDSRIRWAILNETEVLDHGDWGGSNFPFVSVFGPTLEVNGRRDIRGIIRYAKDSQRMLNYLASSAVKRISSANKAPWIADAKSIRGFEKYWKSANTETWSVLPYNSVDPDNLDRPLPAPSRADQTGQINDLLAGAAKFENDLKAVVGIYDAGLGATPNEQSGVAIKTLAQQGQDTNYHWSASLSRSIERLGQLLVELIPVIYDTPRAVRIIGAGNEEKIVRVNEIFTKDGEERAFFLNQGEYSVGTSAGPAYASRKQAALEQLIAMSNGNPGVLPFIQDIIVGQLDFEGAERVEARLKKVLAIQNPALVDEEEMMKLPAEAQAVMAQMSGMVESLTKELQATQVELQRVQMEQATKQIELQGQLALVQAKAEADMRLAEVRAQADLVVARERLENDAAKTRLEHTAKMTETLVKNPGLYGGQPTN